MIKSTQSFENIAENFKKLQVLKKVSERPLSFKTKECFAAEEHHPLGAYLSQKS